MGMSTKTICPECEKSVPMNRSGRMAIHSVRRGSQHTGCPGSGRPGGGTKRVLRYECPECSRVGEWTDGQSVAAGDPVDEYWCQTCGAETPLSHCPRVQS